MVKRQPLLVTTVVLLLLSLFGVANPSVVRAASSPGCTAMNNPALDTTSIDGIVTGSFFAGEVLSVTGSTAGAVVLVVFNGGPVGSGPAPITITYTVPADGTATVAWANIYVSPTAWTISCTPVASTTPGSASAPVVCFPDSRINRNCAAPVAVYFQKTDTGWHLNILKVVGSTGVDFVQLDDTAVSASKGFSFKGLRLYYSGEKTLTLTYARDNGKTYYLSFTVPDGIRVAEGEVGP